MKYGIIGGGVAGLVCAITIKRKNPHFDVTIFEQMNKCGKKLLSSGNGKGNISNKNMDVSYYNTSLIKDIIEADDISFWNSLGVLTKEDNEGRIYPYNESAKSIVDCLNLELNYLGIKIIYEKVVNIDKGLIQTQICDYYVDKIVVTAGGKSSDFLGSDGSLFPILKRIGHSVTELKPGLCPLYVKENFSDISGLRCKVHINAYNGDTQFSDDGEILFKEDGISGIIVFQIASIFARSGYGYLSIDFFKDYEISELVKELEKISKWKYVDLGMQGFINSKLLKHIIGDFKGKTMGDIDLENIAYQLKNYCLKIEKPYPFTTSQVTVGGIDLRELKENLESKIVPDLYFAGEVLDVDGLCGGYNIHFAVCSGLWVGEKI